MAYDSILLAEDNDNDIELCLKAFKQNNLVTKIVITKDGVDTLDYLRCEGKYSDREPGNPLFILLDIKMPKKDGLKVLKEIRETDRLKLIPVTILTSSQQESDILKGYSLGANAYVVKPVDFAKFVDVVREIGLFWDVVQQPPAV